MRGHFIAADASYQSQHTPDKSALLEIIFPMRAKSATIIQSLHSPTAAWSEAEEPPHEWKLTFGTIIQTEHPPAIDSPEPFTGRCTL